MSWPRAEEDDDSAGTFARLRSSSRSREGDFERFAKSIDRSLAVFSLGFCKSVREAPFLMLKRMQDSESSKIKLRDLL